MGACKEIHIDTMSLIEKQYEAVRLLDLDSLLCLWEHIDNVIREKYDFLGNPAPMHSQAISKPMVKRVAKPLCQGADNV